jgi:hypothetical protein
MKSTGRLDKITTFASHPPWFRRQALMRQPKAAKVFVPFVVTIVAKISLMLRGANTCKDTQLEHCQHNRPPVAQQKMLHGVRVRHRSLLAVSSITGPQATPRGENRARLGLMP